MLKIIITDDPIIWPNKKSIRFFRAFFLNRKKNKSQKQMDHVFSFCFTDQQVCLAPRGGSECYFEQSRHNKVIIEHLCFFCFGFFRSLSRCQLNVCDDFIFNVFLSFGLRSLAPFSPLFGRKLPYHLVITF